MSELPPTWFAEIIEAALAANLEARRTMQQQADDEGCGPVIAAIRFAELALAPPAASPAG